MSIGLYIQLTYVKDDNMVKKTVIAAVVIIIVIVVVAAGAYAAFGGKNNNSKDDSNKVTFLIQDGQGVYFWINGNGDTVQDAIENAFSGYPSGTLETDAYGGVSDLFGQSSSQDTAGNWTWWIQFTWKDNSWSCNTTGMDEINSKDVSYELILFGEGNMENPSATQAPAGTPTPSDAVVWDGSTSGTVFQIQSESGLYFKINGTGGATLLDTFQNACNKYKIPAEFGESALGPYLDGIFGMVSSQDSLGNWLYWGEYEHDSTGWVYSDNGMADLTSSGNSQYAVMFGDGSGFPTQ